MERVFLDASFWIAYRDQWEEAHAAARKILGDIFRQRLPMVTTWGVICEIQAYFSRSARMRQVVLEDLWNNPICDIEPVTHGDQAAAIELVRNSKDKSYSLCDATSFVVMRRLAVRQVAAFDDHFRQFGFEVLN